MDVTEGMNSSLIYNRKYNGIRWTEQPTNF